MNPTEPDPDDLPLPTVQQSIPVYQEKANFFRVVHADGVWASVNAWHNIHLTFFSESFAIPHTIYFPVDEKGNVGKELMEKREGKKTWNREMEVDVSLSLEVAKQVQAALANYIKIAENARAEQQK
jgi:hypothetical protein